MISTQALASSHVGPAAGAAEVLVDRRERLVDLSRRIGRHGRSLSVGLLLAALTVSFAVALGQPLGIAPLAIIGGTGIGVAIHLWRNETTLTPALPATAVVIGGYVSPRGLVAVAAIAGVAAMLAARLPAVVRLAQHPALGDVLRTATGAGLCLTASGWAIGTTGASSGRLLQQVAHGHINWAALAAMAFGLGVAVMTRHSKVASLLGGATIAAVVGTAVGAPVIGAVSAAAPSASTSVATSPTTVVLLGLVMAAVVISETAASAHVAGMSGSRHAIFVAGVSTLLAAPGGSPAIAPAPARTHAAGELRADTSAVAIHLALLVAIVASPAVGTYVGDLPLAAVAVPVALAGGALIQLNGRGHLTLVATLAFGVGGGLLIGLVCVGLLQLRGGIRRPTRRDPRQG